MNMLVSVVLALSQLAGAASALPKISISKLAQDGDILFARSTYSKRQNTISTNIVNVMNWLGGGAYFANVTVGTPPQPQMVLLDTGSSDLYFDSPDAWACHSKDAHNCTGGTFDPESSTSYQQIAPSPAFKARYGDGSLASGPFGSDVVGIGDVELSNVQFGVAESVMSTTGHAVGLMGTGYAIGESAVLNGYVDEPYPNIPEVMVAAGAINSRLYSVYLNDLDAWTGTILFGGIDTTRYTGPLVTIDLIPEPAYSIITRFITVVTGVDATIGGRSTTLFSNGTAGANTYKAADSLAVLLDTGSAAWSVPTRFFNSYIAPTFQYVDSDNLCSCKHRDSGDSISVEFNGQITIHVPAREFIIPYINSTTRRPVKYSDGTDACLLAIIPMEDNGAGFMTLGDAILRSMYVVYDLDNGQVSIAQAALRSSASSNEIVVPAGPSGVAKAASNVVTTAPNTWSVDPPQPTNNRTFTAKTLSSTIGTATGTAAIPLDAQVVSTEGAAAATLVPELRWNSGWTVCIAMLMGFLGMGLIL